MCFRPTMDQREDIARDNGYAIALRDVKRYLDSLESAIEWAKNHGREHFASLFAEIEKTITRNGG